MGSEDSGRRPHVLMVTMPFPGHFGPFVQLLYQLSRRRPAVKVTVMGHADRLAEVRRLREGGDLRALDLQLEAIFDDAPRYHGDPRFPVRSATASAQAEVEFRPWRERLLAGKNVPGAPTSMIVDMFLWWSKDVADELGIPWYTLYSTSAWFGVCAVEAPRLLERDLHPTRSAKKAERVDIRGTQFALVADLPHECLEFADFYARVSHRTLRATGILCNSSSELESFAGSCDAMRALVEARKKVDPGTWLENTKVIPIGPMAQIPGFGELYSLKEEASESLKWLDLQGEGSVLYIAFGSLGNVIEELIPQLAMGLEESGVRFLWVLKVPKGRTLGEVLPAGFVERTGGRGLVETGWAPQTRILVHPAVGGFLTHCGWNSVLESLCAGVPMIVWPLSADQPLNARFLTDVQRVGVRIWEDANEELGSVSKGTVAMAMAMARLMVHEEGQTLRRRAKALSQELAAVVAEGGSTFVALQDFIRHLVKE